MGFSALRIYRTGKNTLATSDSAKDARCFWVCLQGKIEKFSKGGKCMRIQSFVETKKKHGAVTTLSLLFNLHVFCAIIRQSSSYSTFSKAKQMGAQTFTLARTNLQIWHL